MGTRITGKAGLNRHLIKTGKKIDCKKIKLCTIFGSGNISEFFLNFAFIYFSFLAQPRQKIAS